MFDDAEKLIFQYAIGTGADGKPVMVFGDPHEIWNELVKQLDGEFGEALDAIQPVHDRGPKGEELPETPGRQVMRARAEERLLAAVRAALGMLPFDRTTGQGATAKQCWSAFDVFMEWLEKNESTGEDSPAGSQPTDGPPAGP